MQLNISKLIAPRFYQLAHLVLNHQYTHFWLNGGRGSTKSTFIALMIILGIMRDETGLHNGIVYRKVGALLKDSVYEQLIWAIEELGVGHLWKTYNSPLKLVYLPTNQKILFRGADKPKKSKSAKLRKGYFAYVWYEELDEFNDITEIDIINQSLLRGGDKFWVFYSYNPPKSINAWVNYACDIPRVDKYVHNSCYLDIPPAWLGEQFIIEAEACKNSNKTRYIHEYLGIAVGTGGSVFENVEACKISNEMINAFKVVRHGVDFGFAVDPFVFISCHYDRKYNDLYIFDEIYEIKLLIEEAIKRVKNKLKKYSDKIIIADSANPQDIATYRYNQVNMYGASKIAGSVAFGIKFLQSINHIYIDRERCPNTYKELVNYEYERNKAGEFISAYPDKDNHAIDALRYALQNDMPSRGKGIRIMK